MTMVHLNVRSWCLNQNEDIEVILPSIKQKDSAKDYYLSGKKYPVLWLLHGTYGCYNDYLRRTNIELYATENDLIVVMPSAMNSNYSNYPEIVPPYNMYDYLTEELMPMIYGWFPASDKKEDNFICGLSMGARAGASKFGFNYPDKFGGVGCMSGVPSDVKYILEHPEHRLYKREKMTVEHNGGYENWKNSYENVWDKVPEVAKMENPPKFYFCCGTNDNAYWDFLHFKEYAKQVGLQATFDAREGYAHEWRFWELELQEILKFFGFTKGFKQKNEESKTDWTLV